MASFVSAVELPANPETAWSFVVNHGETIEPLRFEPKGEQGVGTLNQLSGRLGGIIPIKGTSRTVEWTPPSRCVFESVKPAWPVQTRITETFELHDGGTRHSIRYEVSPVGLVGKMAAPVVCRLMERSRRTFQQRLRAALADSGAGPA